MITYLATLPNVFLFLLLCGVSVVLAVSGVFFVKKYVPLEMRYKDNAVIGNISALISIIYGVLVGLTALYLINNVSYTADAVQREANAVANLYRESKWLPDPAKTRVQGDIEAYINQTIITEWPLMKSGSKLTPEGNDLIEKIASTLHNHLNDAGQQLFLAQEMLSDLKSLYDSRQQRIQMSYTALKLEMWYVIFIGTLLTIGINFLFGMNFYLHLITISAGALMAASMLFLLTALDRPFQGEFVIEPEGLQIILKKMEYDKLHKNTSSLPAGVAA